MVAMDLPGIEPVGLHCHIGSQILDTAPFAEAMDRMMDIASEVVKAGGDIKTIDIGGGLGIQYMPDTPAPSPSDLASAILPIFKSRCKEMGISPMLDLEPGRSIVADTTVMLTGVNVVRRLTRISRQWTLASMPWPGPCSMTPTTMWWRQARPARSSKRSTPSSAPSARLGISSAKDRTLPKLESGDILAFLDAGA